MDNGRVPEAIIPVARHSVEMAEGYEAFLGSLKDRIRTAQTRIALQANSELVSLYWEIGSTILSEQKEHGWGAKVIDRISRDLREAFPGMSGFSPRNLKYMRQFAEAWPDFQFVQQPVAQIPWGTNIVLMQKLHTREERLWYAEKTIEEGWSRNLLLAMIESRLIERAGGASNNFEATLPPADSDMAMQMLKDPYLFDFLGTDSIRRERVLEDKLINHVQEFLLELGKGFAFVGRQVHLEFEKQDYYIDLLFYHLKLRCYVVVELKASEFDPGFLGQLSMYQNLVDAMLRHRDDKPTIGLLLVKEKDKVVVEFSLASYRNPMGVAEWKNEIVKGIPDDLSDGLPKIEDIERELADFEPGES